MNTIRAIAVSTTIMLLSGCATVDLGSTGKLAESGIAGSSKSRTLFTQIKTDINRYQEGEYFLDGLLLGADSDINLGDLGRDQISTACTGNAGRGAALESYLDVCLIAIQNLIDARVSVMDKLSNAYTNLSALASYNATSESQGALASLIGSTNNLAELVDGSQIDSVDSDFLNTVLGRYTAYRQSEAIVASSKQIKRVLKEVIKLLEKEQSIYKDIKQIILSSSSIVTERLWRKGFLVPHKMIQDLSNGAQLDYDPDRYDAVVKSMSESEKDDFDAAVLNVLKLQAARKVDREKASVFRTIALMKLLVNSHTELENSKSISVVQLSQAIDELTVYLQSK